MASALSDVSRVRGGGGGSFAVAVGTAGGEPARWLMLRASSFGGRFMGLYEEQREALIGLMASGIGCAPGDFDGERLVVVDRPPENPWFTALAMTFGVGTVVSVDPAFRAFVDANLPKKHYHAMTALLQRMAHECSTPERRFDFYPPSVCFALNEIPAEPALPEGFELSVRDLEWMGAEMDGGRWENGLGLRGRNAREFRNQFALVLSDAAGEIAAIAGVFMTYGAHEIGVDVARGHRGEGLGALVVRAAAREIVDRGQTPLYGCAPTNIRSQRTALASGFLPVYSDAAVG